MEYENFKPTGLRISKEEKEELIKEGYSYCSNCKTVKLFDNFYKDKSQKYEIESICKECTKDKHFNNRLLDNNKVKTIRNKCRNKYAEKNRLATKEWRISNKDKIRSYKRKKYKEDSFYRMQQTHRRILLRMCRSIQIDKPGITSKVLGYTSRDLKEHLEPLFKEGMTWNNYGEWHIDHIIPISLARDYEHGIELSQLSNLQPLWADENIKKSNLVLEEYNVF